MKKSYLIALTLALALTACSSLSKPGAKSHSHYGERDHLDKIIQSQGSKKYYRALDFEAYQKKHRDFDIPYTHNKYVQKWLDYYMGRGKRGFTRHLTRLSRFMPYIHSIAEEYDVPKDLVYLSMIESGFNTRAKSWAAAVGPWQFIRSTGVMYGLNSDYYMDERRDVEKATHAAIRHLRDLYNDFGHWYLAFAAYNAGPGKVRGAIKRNGRNYWNMVRGRYLRQETKDYVPKILAAASIAKNPAKYGFHNINYQPQIPYEKVRLSGPTDLAVAAQAAGVEPDLIRLLNPELLRDMTPPHIPNYELKIPVGTRQKFKNRYAALSPKERLPQRYHVVRPGEGIKAIAKKYGIKGKDLAQANKGRVKIKKTYVSKKKRVCRRYRKRRRCRTRWVKVPKYSYRVAKGVKLAVPKSTMVAYSSIRDDKAAYRTEGRFAAQSRVATFSDYQNKLSKKQRKRLAKLAKKQKQALQNNTSSNLPALVQVPASLDKEMAFLAPGQGENSPQALQNPSPSAAQLKAAVAALPGKEAGPTALTQAAIKAPKPAPKKTKRRSNFYTVRRGDTLGGIAKRFRVSTAKLKNWNGAKVYPVLRAGAKVRVGGSQVVKYKVRRGDSLYKIARRHSTTVSQLKRVNGRKHNSLRAGEVLVIKK